MNGGGKVGDYIMFKRISCLFGRHTINRRRVWNDGLDFRTRCAICDREMFRHADGWRVFGEEQAQDERRAPHP